MRNRKELEKLLGTETIPKLNEFIDDGTIDRDHLREMAGEMGVIVTFNGFNDKDDYGLSLCTVHSRYESNIFYSYDIIR